MTSFEYIFTLLSIIIGLGITHLLVGLGRLINNPKGVKIYWIHIVWTFFIFFYMVSFWWFEYKFISIQEWTYQIYIFIILYAVMLFFLCVMNMPFYFPENFKEYFFSTRKWFFIILLILNLIDIPDTILKGHGHILNLGIGYAIVTTVNIILSVVAIFSRKELLHGIIVIFFSLYNIWYVINAYKTMPG
jgi:hypothetical protein